MNYEEDWILRQIKNIIKFIKIFILEEEEYRLNEIDNLSYNELKLEIEKELVDKNINEAENILFGKISREKPSYLKIGIEFYDNINDMRDDELERLNFSREEINKGLKDLLEFYEIQIPIN